ncbi:hypothetical protein [Streptomyces sp. NPDC058665]|uniref:hypothetical protein n=1 Tax=Streptomyces sp. NPDC058665 TaxID=3346586 RepID=UPI0036600377
MLRLVRFITPAGRAVAPEASYTATPAADGDHLTQRRTVDRAGNVGPIKDYGFTAGNRDYNRAQKLDIKLPVLDTASADPVLTDTPQPPPAHPDDGNIALPAREPRTAGT